MVLTEELTRAAQNGNTVAIQMWFLTGTRDPNEKDGHGNTGYTLLLRAAQNGHLETMRILLAHGASVNVSHCGGYTALHLVARRGHCTAAVLLLDHGAQVNVRTTRGETPLHYAVQIMRGGHTNRLLMIRLLLHRGADLDARDEDGENPEAYAQHFSEFLEAETFLADVRRAGGWRPYVRYPRFRLLMLRIVAEQGRAETQDTLLRRLFPAGPPAPEGIERTYRAQKGGFIPRGILLLLLECTSSATGARVATTTTPSLKEVFRSLLEARRRRRCRRGGACARACTRRYR